MGPHLHFICMILNRLHDFFPPHCCCLGVLSYTEAVLCQLPVLGKVGIVADISVFTFAFHFNKSYVTLQAS